LRLFLHNFHDTNLTGLRFCDNRAAFECDMAVSMNVTSNQINHFSTDWICKVVGVVLVNELEESFSAIILNGIIFDWHVVFGNDGRLVAIEVATLAATLVSLL
jgi:hypothetical protein